MKDSICEYFHRLNSMLQALGLTCWLAIEVFGLLFVRLRGQYVCSGEDLEVLESEGAWLQ